MFAERTESGRLSRLPPKTDDGARALTEASVSRDRRRRSLVEEASVRMEALSVRRLFAVAVEYVVGWPGAPAGARCGGMAGNGWLKWMACELPCWVEWLAVVTGVPFTCTDCMVVRVVVRDRTDGAGDEKVLSPPL